MVTFTKKETDFMKEQIVARVSTISQKEWPQTTPILYVFDGQNIYFAIDFTTKKYKNLKSNPRISIAIDVYARTPRAVTVQGNAEILEKGPEFRKALDLIIGQLEYYKNNPFKEGEAAIVKIVPVTKSSW